MKGLGALGALSQGLQSYQNQIDRQKEQQIAQLKLQQQQVEFKYLQQQQQAAQWSDKLDSLAYLSQNQPEQAPPPGPYDVSQSQPPQQNAPPSVPGGLPGAQPMPPQMPGGPQQPQMLPGAQMMRPQGGPLQGMPQGQPGMPPQGMRPPMQGQQPPPGMQRPQGMPPGGAPPQQMQRLPMPPQGQTGQQPQQQGGVEGIGPPPTMQTAQQFVMQQAQARGIDLRQAPPGAVRQAMQNVYKQQVEDYKLKLEGAKADQAEQDRQLSIRDREQAQRDRERDQQENRAEREEMHRESEHDRMAMHADTMALAGNKGWTFMTGQNGKMYRANAGTGKVEPVEDAPAGGLAKVGAAGQGQASQDDIKAQAKGIATYELPPAPSSRGNGTKIMAEVMRQNPDYDAKKYQQYQRGYTAFTSGSQGNVVRSLGVADSHLAVLSDAADALHNGNVNLINSFKQRWEAETGNPAPSTFDGMKSIVADEVAKAVIGGQTAQADREKLSESLKRASSPQQLAGVIKGYRQLMKGQLSGLRRQYKAATNREDFDTLLPENMAGEGEAAAPKPAQGATADYSHLWGGGAQ